MAKLIFVTHPEVKVDPSIPREEWVLSAVGQKELQNLLTHEEWSIIDEVYCSSEPKACHVAEEIASRFNLKISKVKGLEEVDRSSTGFIEGEKYRLAMEDFYIHPADSYKGWETAYEATERIKKSIDEIARKSTESTIVIIGHAIIGSCLSCYVRGIDPCFNEDNNILGSYICIDWTNKKILDDWRKY